MAILSLNTGSSSVKYGLFDEDSLEPLARGMASRIGETEGRVEHDSLSEKPARTLPLPNHRSAVQALLAELNTNGNAGSITAVGHRVVHGGDRYSQPATVDESVLRRIRELGRLAPLHNAINLTGIEVARAMLPGAEHVAVFDTAFHAGMPANARRYAIPGDYTRRGFRRYGFHGISHAAVAEGAARHLERPLESLRLITLHLGSGASAAAIREGTSIDTSMGMTPLEGLVMGSRCGDIDPGAVLRLLDVEGLSPGDVEHLLNQESGLRALAGTGDMREIEVRANQGDEAAREAIALFCYRVKKYIGAYYAVLGGVDALVFTGGIGENAPSVRAQCCEGMDALGIGIDAKANEKGLTAIHADRIPILVMPANEELAIARATAALLQREPDGATS